MTEPPGPPLPPSGPPRGLNFSRCTEATPLPPRPAATCNVTRSTNDGTAMVMLLETDEGRPRPGTPFSGPAGGSVAGRDDVDDAAPAAGAELDVARDQREQGVVATATDARARVEVGAPLTHDDLTGVDQLAAVALHAEALGVGVAAVLGGRRALLVCHESGSFSGVCAGDGPVRP